MDFVHQDLADQVQAVHIVVSPLDTVQDLPKLCLSPVPAIPQVGRRPHLIFDFPWIDLNEATSQEAPKEVVRFGGTLGRIIRPILQVKPQIGPVYLGKVYLIGAYMWMWVRLEDTPSVAFLVRQKNPTDEQLVGFHLALTMGYVDSTPFF